MTPARVSVIVPAYQAERTLAATLASARAQTARDIEILVVDDGSTDATGAIARAAAAEDARVTVIAQGNAGVAAARNAAIAAARGCWIAPLDADDLWHPLKIERQLAAAEAARPAPDLIYCWSRGIDAEDWVLRDHGRPAFRGDALAAFVASNPLYSASIPLLRRDAVERAGGFDASLQAAGAQGAEDLQLWLALAEAGPVELAPGFLVGYRTAPGSMSRAGARMHRSLGLVLDGLARRRPDLPAALLRLGQLNADMYAASLALAGGDRAGFLARIGASLARDPDEALRFLACQAAMRSLGAGAGTDLGERTRFLDLDPDLPLPGGAADRLDELRRAAIGRAAGGWRPGGAAWEDRGMDARAGGGSGT